MVLRCSNAFGLGLRSDLPLAGLVPAHPVEPAVSIRLATAGEIAGAWTGTEHRSIGVLPDGCRCVAERARGGELRIAYGDRALYLLSADAATILCAPEQLEEPTWQRFLLDAVLLKASEAHGLEALHASAVQGPDGVLAFATQAGGGKSSLASELVRRGHPFFADDALALRRDDGEIRAHPAPPLMNFPLDHPEGFDAGELGTVQAVVGPEAWLAVRHAATAPCRVAAIHLLDRRPGLRPGLELLPSSPVPLLEHVLGDLGSRARMACRFELLADLVAGTAVYRLRADPATPVSRLAELVESAF
ncbi:MAG: hypothetical protein M3350_05635 [Actinomycetota bacterium]|nr:hypothetical protein [Actinomycetota bacterium]